MRIQSGRWLGKLSAWGTPTRVAVLLLGVVLVFAFAVRAANIRESLPYCRHPDENTWMKIAWRMLRDGDPNPRRFTKPSLPAYTMVASSYVGFQRAKWAGEVRRVRDLGRSGFPHYRVPAAVEVVKWTFAGFSVAALALLGFVAWKVSGRSSLLYAAPAIGLVSSSYLYLSWHYVNVDTPGVFFIWATIAHLVSWNARAGAATDRANLRDVAIAAVLCGLAVGSKYNLYPLAVPCAAQLLFLGWRRLIVHGAVFGVVLVLTFLATTPFAIFDNARFIAHVKHEIRHYATGHEGKVLRGFEPFLAYGKVLWDNWGPLLALALVGLVDLVRRNYKLAILVFAQPLVFLAYMSMQRVVFERNIMSLHLSVALAVALAAAVLGERLAGLGGRWVRWQPARLRAAGLVAAFVLVAALVPWPAVRAAYGMQVESRTAVAEWIRANFDRQTPIFVDKALHFDERTLGKGYTVKSLNAADMPAARSKADSGRDGAAAIAIVAEANLRKTPFATQEPAARFGNQALHRSGLALRGNPALVAMEVSRTVPTKDRRSDRERRGAEKRRGKRR